MRDRLGKEASDLIDSDQYLPMYRNRQIHYPELFAFSVKLAQKAKTSKSGYFARMWSSKELTKSIEWLTKLMNLAQSKAAEMVRDTKQRWADIKEAAARKKNSANIERLDKMRQQFSPGRTPLRS